VERLRYILSHGCKENLVARLTDWPGIHMVQAILSGQPFTGYWFDRSQEYAARCRREELETHSYASPVSLSLDQLPCWKHLTTRQYRACILAMVKEIEAEAARKRTGAQPLGRQAILQQDSLHRPDRVKKSPAPRIHAMSQSAKQLLAASRGWGEVCMTGGLNLGIWSWRSAPERWRPAQKPSSRSACFPKSPL
jgi:hypothetical protein